MRRLIIRPGAIGDCIVTLPALAALTTPESEIWLPRPVLPLIRFPCRAVCALPDTGIDWLGLPGVAPPPTLLQRLASFDEIVSWYGATREDFQLALRALGLRAHLFKPLPMDARAEEGYPPAVDYHLQQIRPLIAASPSRTPSIPCPPRTREFIVLHPFSGSRKKNWPLERFQQLAHLLSSHATVHFCAGPEDDLPGATRFPDLYELACWLQGARLYVGNDSGISHLAAAAGVPTLTIFGPTDPRVWAPRGACVRVVAPPHPGRPVAEVTLDEVWRAARHMLGLL